VSAWIHIRRGGREPASRGWFKSPSRYKDFSIGKSSLFSVDVWIHIRRGGRSGTLWQTRVKFIFRCNRLNKWKHCDFLSLYFSFKINSRVV
jgi:hypothetical protein